MAFWVILWKCVFIGTVGIYAIMAIWVTFQGARDIKSMFADLQEQHDKKQENQKS